MRKFFFPLLAAAILSAACNNNKGDVASLQKTIDSLKAVIGGDHSAEVAAIQKADSAWSASKSAEEWLSFYSNDAIMMPPGENVCADAASREASIKNMYKTPGLNLTFHSVKVEVSKSGELGYAMGVYNWKSKDAKGKDYHETGKYTEVWKKQADGSWKCIADIWNADPPVK